LVVNRPRVEDHGRGQAEAREERAVVARIREAVAEYVEAGELGSLCRRSRQAGEQGQQQCGQDALLGFHRSLLGVMAGAGTPFIRALS
jgi:hypothetical protein